MKCIKNEIIIQYLDNQLSPSEKNSIEDHLSHCNKCNSAVTNMRDKIVLVKKDLALLNPETVNIPLFIVHDGTHKQKHFRKILHSGVTLSGTSYTWIKRLAIPLAAILIVCIGVIIHGRIFGKKSDIISTEAIFQDLDEIIVTDPNEWWTDRRLVIIIIDEDKNTVERIITSKNEEDVIRQVTHLQ